MQISRFISPILHATLELTTAQYLCQRNDIKPTFKFVHKYNAFISYFALGIEVASPTSTIA